MAFGGGEREIYIAPLYKNCGARKETKRRRGGVEGLTSRARVSRLSFGELATFAFIRGLILSHRMSLFGIKFGSSNTKPRRKFLSIGLFVAPLPAGPIYPPSLERGRYQLITPDGRQHPLPPSRSPKKHEAICTGGAATDFFPDR